MRYKAIAFMAILMMVTALFTGVAQAGGYYTKTLTVAAGATNKIDWIDLNTTTIGCQAIDRVVVTHPTGAGTGTVYFASYDFEVASTLFNSGALIPAAIVNPHPKYEFATAKVESVVTSEVPYTVASAITNAEPYMVRQLRLNVIQVAQPTADTYNVGVFTK